jgi:hypothetical protein
VSSRKFEFDANDIVNRQDLIGTIDVALIMHSVRITKGSYKVTIEKLPKKREPKKSA